MKNALVCLAVLLLSGAASAQALWRGVPAGASPAEVQALIPEALPAPAELLARDGRALLAIPRFELAGADFAVSFLFERERLTSVLLLADAGSAEQARDVAQNLTASLRARYGLELSSKSRKDALTYREPALRRGSAAPERPALSRLSRRRAACRGRSAA
jgi:hypothetical protein